MEQFVSALDFGDSYIKLVKVSICNGSMHICSTIKTLTKGYKNGEIYSKVELQQAIRLLISKCDKKDEIHSVVVILPSTKLSVSRKQVELNNPRYPDITTKEDVFELQKLVSTTGLKETEMAVGMFPLTYYSDDRDIDKLEPYGERVKKIGLEALVHALPISSARGFIDAIEEMGIRVLDAYIAPLANATLCLKQNETKEGCILLDLGDSGVSINAFYNNYLLVHYRTKLGINHIIHSLQDNLNIDEDTARNYLYKYGVGNSNDGSSYNIINSTLKEIDITSSIEYSINEMILEVKKTIEEFLNDSANLPVILTGGGANIYRLDNAISNILKKNTIVRGYSKIGGRDYSYNACIGGVIRYLSKK